MTAPDANSPRSLMANLREQTREQHDRLHRVEYHRALRDGDLPIESYAALLRALAVIHEVLENHLAKTGDPNLQAVWRDDIRKAPMLRRDLEYLRSRRLRDIPAAAERAVKVSDDIRLRFARNPVSLLGYLYVMEGSTMGAPLVVEWLADAFDLRPGRGLEYFINYGDSRKARWREFSGRVDALKLDEDTRRGIIEAAREAFDGLTAIYHALYPVDDDSLSYTATALNPDAGRHPVPDDPAELEAAVAAGERSLAELPYMEQRYGERGRRFSDSDSAWLATLIQFDQPELDRQVQWLGRVLAGRGMPRVVLEIHLDLLADELSRANPGKSGQYVRLRRAADSLRYLRRKHIAEDDVSRMEREFDQRAPIEWTTRLPRTGLLLASAAADEADGLANAVESLVGWLTDTRRFPEAWVAAVRDTVAEARRLTGNACGEG